MVLIPFNNQWESMGSYNLVGHTGEVGSRSQGIHSNRLFRVASRRSNHQETRVAEPTTWRRVDIENRVVFNVV